MNIQKLIICMLLSIALVFKCFCIIIYAEKNEYTLCNVLIEAESKVIISSDNENIPVPIGVMSKLMTVYIVAKEIENNKLSTTDILKTSTYANSAKGATIWLSAGEEITVDELLKAVIIGNANDAAIVLAEKIYETEENFVIQMNENAIELGMKNTYFTNCNGYNDDDKQISTAYDLAILCAELSKYDFLQSYFTCWRDYVRNSQAELVNSNELVKSYKGLIGFKAGFTEHSGYCAAIAAQRNGTTYISVILGCQDKSDALHRAKVSLDAAFSQYKIITPEIPQNIPSKISVKGGISKSVAIDYGKIRSVVLPDNTRNSITSKIIITDYIYAPVQKGEKVGEIQFLKNDKLMFCVDIVTKENIEEINVSKALSIILKKLLTF